MSESLTIDSASQELIDRIRITGGLFAKDLAASSHEVLADHPGGKARCGYDLVYEVAGLNRLVAAKAMGESFEQPQSSGWVLAPETFKQKAAAEKAFDESVEAVCAALPHMTPARRGELVDTPFGPLPLMRLAGIIPMHHMYHSGQLNYIQTLHGDDESHW